MSAVIGNKRRQFHRFVSSPFVGVLLLLLAYAIGSTVLYWHTFSDEADKFAGGLLISQGYVLYRDLFAHHFPFPYYWTALFLYFLPTSVLVVRLSVLWFQLITFSALMQATRRYVAIGGAAVAWNAVAYIYFGHMVLYQTFAGIVLVAVFVLVVDAIVAQSDVSTRRALMVGAFAAIAVLSDPLAVFPVSLAFLVLVFSRKYARGAFIAGTTVAVLLSCYGLYLLYTNSLNNFLRDAIYFNLNVYSKYYNSSPLRLLDVYNLARTALRLASPETWMPAAVAPVISYTELERWLFAGAPYRLFILLSVAVLLLKKQFRAAFFVYFFAILLLIRSEVFTRAIPFNVLSIFGGTLLAVWGYETDSTDTYTNSALVGRLQTGSRVLMRTAAGLLIALLIVRGSIIIRSGRLDLSYEENLERALTRTEDIEALACGRNAKLAYYPGDPLIYFLSRMKPVSEYTLMWPWIAEVGQEDVITRLSSDDIKAVVFIQKNGIVWGTAVEKYLRPLITFLDQNYVALDPNHYVSPALANTCDKF